jgi:hypothetical protein
MVPPGKMKNLESDLTGLSYSIMIPDVQKVIDLEKVASSSAGHKLTAGKISQNYSISLCNVAPCTGKPLLMFAARIFFLKGSFPAALFQKNHKKLICLTTHY